MSSEREKVLRAFEKRIGLRFKNRERLDQVFVHRSYLNENPTFPLEHNERLEFLGDAVLELVVTEHLFRNFRNPEGELTNWRSTLVRGPMLAGIARELGIGELLYLSRGEAKSGGSERELILANTFEALVGAIYLELGMAHARSFVERFLLKKLPEIIAKRLWVDPKSALQEYTQEHFQVTPSYRVLAETGPDHAKEFEVGVYFGEELKAKGSGTSKQAAEEEAARAALEALKH